MKDSSKFGFRILKAVLYILYVVAVFELGSFLILTVFADKQMQHRIEGTLNDHAAPNRDVSFYTPYVWSGFAPNPRCERNNQFGWRYGGGEKKTKLRILCLGGSTTYSEGTFSGDFSYPAQLETYLRSKGYDIDVVNGGMSYFTSAECLATLCYRGVYLKPDVVLIHTGDNDSEPLEADGEYMPDYTHWRGPGINRKLLFQTIWKIPSWTVRLIEYYTMKPDGSGMLSRHLQNSLEIYTSHRDISNRYPVGLAMNIQNMIAVSRSCNAKPVVVLFNLNPSSENGFRALFKDKQTKDYAWSRLFAGAEIDRRIMDSVAHANNTGIINLEDMKLSDPSHWLDHAHLDSIGDKEKAEFIGNWLIESGTLKE
jgi:hypothetical protein